MAGTSNTHELDGHILASCHDRWQKVAMVIAKTEERVGLGEDQRDLDAIAARIEALVAAGQLEGVGDLKLWRLSEVRVAARP